MAQTEICRLGDFVWIDLLDPSPGELDAIAVQYKLPPHTIQACLDPEHLPKFESFEHLHFLILRAYDENASPSGDSVQELTRKLAIFYETHFLITVHRREQAYFSRVRDHWREKAAQVAKANPGSEKSYAERVMLDLIHATLTTFEKPIDQGLDDLDRLETEIFGTNGVRANTHASIKVAKGYYLKRKGSVYKRLLKLTVDLLPRLSTSFTERSPKMKSRYQGLKETAESLVFFADELSDNVAQLLNLHLSLASHRTNEVVRVLTIFSVFLLPLNVFTGIYGMNFEHMPGLHWHFGYLAVLAVMILATAGIYFGFRRNGWLR